MINWTTVAQGLQVTMYGLLGVFLVLILFYVLTKLMVILANKVPSKKPNE